MLVVVPGVREGDLVRAEGPLHLVAVDHRRTGPALGRPQHDHRSPPTFLGVLTSFHALSHRRELVEALVERAGHRLVHRTRFGPGDDPWRIATAAQQVQKVVLGDTGEQRRVGDLELVEMEDREDHAVASRMQEPGRVPARRERAGLGLSVADHAEDDELRVVQRGSAHVQERVPELAALVEGAGSLGRAVTGYPTGERELAEERPHAGRVLREVTRELRVGALQPRAHVGARPSVSRTGDEGGLEVTIADRPIRVRPDEIQSGNRSEVAEEAGLDVLAQDRSGDQRVVHEVDLADGEIVRGAPPRVDLAELVRGERARDLVEVVRWWGHRRAVPGFLVVGRGVPGRALGCVGHDASPLLTGRWAPDGGASPMVARPVVCGR